MALLHLQYHVISLLLEIIILPYSFLTHSFWAEA